MLIGHIAVRAPFPWRHLLDYFAHRLIPQVERIENDCYVRQEGARTIAVAYDPASAQLQVTANGRVKTEPARPRRPARQQRCGGGLAGSEQRPLLFKQRDSLYPAEQPSKGEAG